MAEKLLYSVRSAALALDASPGTVERLVQDGELETIKLRGKQDKSKGLRITANSLEAWITKRLSESRARDGGEPMG
jgi:hypothetical protein